MHIVIVGMGEVGRHLLRALETERHDIVAVDISDEALEDIGEHHDVATLLGYGASEELLLRAGAAKSDLVVAVTDHDEVNLIAALASKRLGARRSVARTQASEWAQWKEGVRYGLLGVDVVINPRILVAQELARIARSHGASEVVDLARDLVELVSVTLSKDTRYLSRPISDLDLPEDVLIAAIVRDDEVFVPGGGDILKADDRVYFVGRPASIRAAEDMFAIGREARRVFIVGGGVIGEALARELAEGKSKVVIVDRNKARAEALADALDGVTVVHGDGTQLSLLEQEEIGTYDLVAAVTQEDEVNLMVGLLAKRAGAKRAAAVVHRADYLDIYRQLGLDIVVAPRTVASDQIVRHVRTSDVVGLTTLEEGKAEVLEIQAMRGCRGLGLPIREMGLPRGALVTAIARGNEVLIPHGDDVVGEGDIVVVLTLAAVRPLVERIFRPRRV